MRRIVAVSLALIGLFVTGCSAQGLVSPTGSARASDTCAKLFVAVVAEPQRDSTGMWNCLAERSQQDYFYRLGWHNDDSVGRWVRNHFGDTRQHVDAFYHNPVSYCRNTDNAGNCTDMVTAFVYRLSLVQDDGTWDVTASSSSGFTVVVDAHGRVLEVV